MKFKFQNQLNSTKNILIIPVIDANNKNKILKEIGASEGIPTSLLKHFSAKQNETLLLSGKKAQSLFLLGLGKKPKLKNIISTFRSFAFRQKDNLTKAIEINLLYIPKSNYDLDLNVVIQDVVNGLLLGTYQIGLYKTDKKEQHPLIAKTAMLTFYTNSKEKTALTKAAQKGKAAAETQLSIFNLVNAPGNKVRPEELARWAVASARKYGYKTTVFTKAKIKAKGLEALLAVNRGSEYPPAFIIMEYLPKKAQKKNLPKIGLVGKGVTFDTGGLSIKGHQNMHYMKSDMGGAAAVLGTMELAAKLQLPVHLIGIVPSTDNCVDATSIKPGDVINSYSGKTIEVIDTDAEGRLILADGLAYMEKNYQPDIMIDLATLTGSTVRTLGYQAAALFTGNDKLADQFSTIGETIGERVWRLPLWDAYKKDIESDVADLRNFSGRPLAGAISAAKFLEAFTNEHKAWVHLDIAGVAFGDSEFSKQKSATGYGIQLLTSFIEQHSS